MSPEDVKIAAAAIASSIGLITFILAAILGCSLESKFNFWKW